MECIKEVVAPGCRFAGALMVSFFSNIYSHDIALSDKSYKDFLSLNLFTSAGSTAVSNARCPPG